MDWKFNEFTLDNGFKITYKPTNTETVYAKLTVDHGSLNERKGEEGLAHFMEHCLIYGGTEKFTSEESVLNFSQFGEYNAETGLHFTRIFADMVSDDLEKFLEVAHQTFFQPSFDPKMVGREKLTVLGEISETKSNELFKDREKMRKLIFKDHGYSYFSLGKESVIKNVDIDTLINFHRRGFTAPNSELVIVGKIPNDIIEVVNGYFGKLAGGENSKYEFDMMEKIKGKNTVHSKTNNINSDNPLESIASLYMTFSVPNYLEDNWISALVLSDLISGKPLVSRLYKKLREEKRLSYGVGGGYTGVDKTGYLDISAKVPAAKLDESVDYIFEMFDEIRDGNFLDNELDMVKKDKVYGLLKYFETNRGNMGILNRVRRSKLTPTEFLEKVNALTKDDVVEAANLYLPTDRENGNYALWLVDPLKKE